MGKFATYQKRGGSGFMGPLTAPRAADFSVGTITTSAIPINRGIGFPGGADGAAVMDVKVSDGTPIVQAPTAATPIANSGLTTGTQYRVYVSWYNGTARVSDWTLVSTSTTL